jgi:hypothetical protein
MFENSNKPPKSKEEYSRNVKLLKLKLEKLANVRSDLERKRSYYDKCSIECKTTQ